MYAKFPYGPLRIKKALGIFSKSGNKKNNNRRSDLGPFPGPKIEVSVFHFPAAHWSAMLYNSVMGFHFWHQTKDVSLDVVEKVVDTSKTKIMNISDTDTTCWNCEAMKILHSTMMEQPAEKPWKLGNRSNTESTQKSYYYLLIEFS